MQHKITLIDVKELYYIYKKKVTALKMDHLFRLYTPRTVISVPLQSKHLTLKSTNISLAANKIALPIQCGRNFKSRSWKNNTFTHTCRL